jgi:hypothetical protein
MNRKKTAFFQVIKAAFQVSYNNGFPFVLFHFEMIETVTLTRFDTKQVSKGFKLAVF